MKKSLLKSTVLKFQIPKEKKILQASTKNGGKAIYKSLKSPE